WLQTRMAVLTAPSNRRCSISQPPAGTKRWITTTTAAATIHSPIREFMIMYQARRVIGRPFEVGRRLRKRRPAARTAAPPPRSAPHPTALLGRYRDRHPPTRARPATRAAG